MLVRPKGTNLVVMMMMRTSNVGQATRHQPGNNDDVDDDGTGALLPSLP